MAAVKLGDAPVRRHGATVSAEPGPRSEMTLGPPFPAEFRTKYQKESPIGGVDFQRSRSNKILQRYHEQNQELRLAKSLNKAPRIPDFAVRRERARADQKELADVAAKRWKVLQDVSAMRDNLKLYDFDSMTPHQRWLMDKRLAKLQGAPDDATRLALMKNPEYAQAAFAAGEDHTFAGFQSEMKFKGAYSEEWAAHFPSEMQFFADHALADESLDHVWRAAKTANENELRAIGEPLVEAKAQQPGPEWE